MRDSDIAGLALFVLFGFWLILRPNPGLRFYYLLASTGLLTLSVHTFLEPAPHAAGVAALLIQAAGGPGTISAAAADHVMQQTTAPRDSHPFL
jgi:hypothetical protein